MKGTYHDPLHVRIAHYLTVFGSMLAKYEWQPAAREDVYFIGCSYSRWTHPHAAIVSAAVSFA